jgi:hypothetical protein
MESLRSVKVHIEIDTNKKTLVMHEAFTSITEAEEAIGEFLSQEIIT